MGPMSRLRNPAKAEVDSRSRITFPPIYPPAPSTVETRRHGDNRNASYRNPTIPRHHSIVSRGRPPAFTRFNRKAKKGTSSKSNLRRTIMMRTRDDTRMDCNSALVAHGDNSFHKIAFPANVKPTANNQGVGLLPSDAFSSNSGISTLGGTRGVLSTVPTVIQSPRSNSECRGMAHAAESTALSPTPTYDPPNLIAWTGPTSATIKTNFVFDNTGAYTFMTPRFANALGCNIVPFPPSNPLGLQFTDFGVYTPNQFVSGVTLEYTALGVCGQEMNVFVLDDDWPDFDIIIGRKLRTKYSHLWGPECQVTLLHWPHNYSNPNPEQAHL